METLAITGFICFVVGGVFGWFLRPKFGEMKDRVSKDLNPLLGRLEGKLDELKKEFDKLKK